jgi:hypothetical protein
MWTGRVARMGKVTNLATENLHGRDHLRDTEVDGR